MRWDADEHVVVVEKPVKRPMQLRVGFGIYVGTAILNVLVGGYILFGIGTILAEDARRGHHATPAGVVFVLILTSAATLVFSGAIAVLAFRLRAGGKWARPTLLTVSLLSLIGLLTGTSPSWAIVLLLIAGAVLVTRQPVTAWLRAMQGLPPV